MEMQDKLQSSPFGSWEGGDSGHPFPDLKWWGCVNGGKNQNPQKSLDFPAKPKEIPWTKIKPPKNLMLNFLTSLLCTLIVALFTDNILHLHYNETEHECKAILGKNDKTAWNCLVSMLHCIVMQMSKVICEKGYYLLKTTAFNKCGCTTFIALCMSGILHQSSCCFQYPQKNPYLNQATKKKNYLPKFFYPKTPGIENFKPPKIVCTWL